MSEFIISNEQLEGLIEGIEHDTRRKINRVVCEGIELPEIVRCFSCKYGHEVTWPVQSEIPKDYLDCVGPLVETWDYYNDEPKDNPVPPDGFCKWGERKGGDSHGQAQGLR